VTRNGQLVLHMWAFQPLFVTKIRMLQAIPMARPDIFSNEYALWRCKFLNAILK